MAIATVVAPAGIMLAESESIVAALPSLLDALREPDRTRLLAVGERRIFLPGQFVWRQGDPHKGIHVIQSGRIKSFYAAPSGREVTLAYWFSGNFLGGPDLFGVGPHMWSSVAVDRSELTFIPGPALRKLATESNAIALALLDALTLKSRCYSAMAQMLGTRSVTERLHRLLLFLASVYGVQNGRVVSIAAPFTHGDLANLIGSTRQWVTIQLARMQDRGIITYDRGLISILRKSAFDLEMV